MSAKTTIRNFNTRTRHKITFTMEEIAALRAILRGGETALLEKIDKQVRKNNLERAKR